MLRKIYIHHPSISAFAQKEIGMKEKQIIMGATFSRTYIYNERYFSRRNKIIMIKAAR